MDYLNPKKRRSHLIRLFTGYGLISIAVVLAVVIFTYLLNGWVYSDGRVVQNGMMFVSSTPSGANIMINGKSNGAATKRLIMPAGNYQIELSRPGYRDWQRSVVLGGNKVQRYNYPLLIPNQLTSTPVLSLDGAPQLVSESPNDRWLIVSDPGEATHFKLIDLNNPLTPVITNLILPVGLVSPGQNQNWQLDQWSDDNQHVLLRHNYGAAHEFIMMDISDPASSFNLKSKFAAVPSDVRLFNESYDEYWFFDEAAHQLSQASLSTGVATPYLSNVLAFKGYSDSVVLYITPASNGQARIVWYQNGQGVTIKNGLKLQPTAEGYLIDLATYEGNWYVVAGEKDGDGVTVFKNPQELSNIHPEALPRAYATLRVDHPTYIKFSANAQFVLAENGDNVAVFNAQYDTSYNYKIEQLDAPQTNVNWMDGYHLLHVAHGQLVLSDFNNINNQVLVAASANYEPFFDSNDEYLFSLQTSVSGGSTVTVLSRTPLRLPADI